MSREYDPFEDENYGKRNYGPIDWSGHPWLEVYMAKLYKGWPANMAAVAANRAMKEFRRVA